MAKKPATDLESLAKKVEYLLDRQAVIDCIHQYCRALDRHDEELLADVFHPDAVDNHSGWVGYIPEFRKWGIEVHDHLAGHGHNMTTHRCDIDGDTAHAETYVIFVHRPRDNKNVIVGGGRYVDKLEKRDGAWRIVLRRMLQDWRFEANGEIWSRMKDFYPGSWNRQDPSYERPLTLPPEVAKQLAKKPKPKS